MTVSAIYDEAVAAEQSALVEMYELTLPAPIAQLFPELAIMRFCRAPNALGQPVVWKGNMFLPIPVEADGFGITTKGSLSRPTLTFANVDSLLTGLVNDLDDLIGVTVKRLRTFERFLDAVNFPGGVNIDANPNYELPTERYIVERKTAETNTIVSFELASALDLNGVKLPLRQIQRNVCGWQYRKDGCGYAGPPVASVDNARLPNTLNAYEKGLADQCSKSLKGCRLRFSGPYDELPFGGFPGVVLRNGGD